MDEVLERISRCLADEGLSATHDEANRCWWVTFDIDGRAKPTMLIHPPNDEYVISAAEIVSPVLAQRAISALSTDVLAMLLEHSPDETFLARVTYVPNGPAYYATSACSIDGPSGKKLRRRMEACARMAVSLEKALNAKPSKPQDAHVPQASRKKPPSSRKAKQREAERKTK